MDTDYDYKFLRELLLAIGRVKPAYNLEEAFRCLDELKKAINGR